MMRVFIDTNILIDYALGREHEVGRQPGQPRQLSQAPLAL